MRRRAYRAEIARLREENAALRHAVTSLGRQLHRETAAQTVPISRVRSEPAPGPSIDLTRAGDETQLLMRPLPLEWRPKNL